MRIFINILGKNIRAYFLYMLYRGSPEVNFYMSFRRKRVVIFNGRVLFREYFGEITFEMCLLTFQMN